MPASCWKNISCVSEISGKTCLFTRRPVAQLDLAVQRFCSHCGRSTFLCQQVSTTIYIHSQNLCLTQDPRPQASLCKIEFPWVIISNLTCENPGCVQEFSCVIIFHHWPPLHPSSTRVTATEPGHNQLVEWQRASQSHTQTVPPPPQHCRSAIPF